MQIYFRRGRAVAIAKMHSPVLDDARKRVKRFTMRDMIEKLHGKILRVYLTERQREGRGEKIERRFRGRLCCSQSLLRYHRISFHINAVDRIFDHAGGHHYYSIVREYYA